MLLIVTSESKEVNLLGDLNVDYLKKNDNTNIKEIIKLYGFKQLITKATRVTETTSTLIDCILTTRSDCVYENDVIPTSISDHDMVGFIRKSKRDKIPPRTVRSRMYRNYNHQNMSAELRNHDWNPIYAINEVNTAWKYLKDVLLKTFDKHAPIVQRRVKGQFCPWLNSEIYQFMNDRDKALRKARKTKSTADWKYYRKLRNECTTTIRIAKSIYSKDLLKENANNPKKFWDTIKKIMPTKPNKTPCENTSNHLDKANSLCNFFSKVAFQLKSSSYFLKDFVWSRPKHLSLITCKTFKFKYVSRIFIEKQLKKLKRNKATGADDLPPGLLKDCASEITQPLCHLINLSLKHSEIPSDWKHALITPIFKSGSTNDPNNYRPISILPILSKILEKSVHQQLMDYLEDNTLLSRNQFGYRRMRSTDLATTLLLDDIRREVDKGKLVGVMFMDLSKAFDTISHATLLEKLKAYGINDGELYWFTTYLFNRTQQVVLDNVKSKIEHVNCGVPQGSILGPLLFLVFFNDFPEVLIRARTIQFADDTVIYFASDSFIVIQNLLNRDLLNVENYLRDNDLVINLKKGKTEYMLVGTSKKLKSVPSEFKLLFNFAEINRTYSYKYLGSIVDHKLSLTENFCSAYKKASSRLRLLSALKSQMDNSTATTIYNTMITPLITFNSIINMNFTTTQLKKLSSLDRRACDITNNAKLPSLYNKVLRNGCLIVRKCLDNNVCYNFLEYFKTVNHDRTTRNNHHMIQIPKVRLKMAKNGFFYMGALIYNKLPLPVRKEHSFVKFKDFFEKTYFLNCKMLSR